MITTKIKNNPLDSKAIHTNGNLKRYQIMESTFSYLLSAILHSYKHSERIEKLSSIGYRMGCRVHELCALRANQKNRDNTIEDIFLFIKDHLWPMLYQTKAYSAQRASEDPDTWYIYSIELLEQKFIETAKVSNSEWPGRFTLGIIDGLLTSADFPTESVDITHSHGYYTFVIKLKPHVRQRDQHYSK
mmetsp:Transcript_9145/g.13523  ORF Transcript_9145/g.13523 Transcript_9145/m.13523 type:complete len:188 (+) Transcript_9145:80-643(+)